MGYTEAEGVILNRRNVFEDDQEIFLLTSNRGGLEVRAPHARKSQKTYCGRLEVPNHVTARLYRAKEQSDWVMTDVDIEESYADLLRNGETKNQIWPVISLYKDLFPEGESPGDLVQLFCRGLDLLDSGFSPSELVVNRLLVKTAVRVGIDLNVEECNQCGRSLKETGNANWSIVMERGVMCEDCSEDGSFRVISQTLDAYDVLRELSWEEVCAKRYSLEALQQLEELLYRLFHYHFEISLETLKIRKKL